MLEPQQKIATEALDKANYALKTANNNKEYDIAKEQQYHAQNAADFIKKHMDEATRVLTKDQGLLESLKKSYTESKTKVET